MTSDILSADTIDRLRQVTTATLASQLFKRGAPLPGTYPPSEATRAEYEAFRRGPSQPS